MMQLSLGASKSRAAVRSTASVVEHVARPSSAFLACEHSVSALPPECSEVPTPFQNSEQKQVASEESEDQCASLRDDATLALLLVVYEQTILGCAPWPQARTPPGTWQSPAPLPPGLLGPEVLGAPTDYVDALQISVAMIPRSERGELTSHGSIKHSSGQCAPCIFWFRGQCKRSVNCSYCHMVHENQKAKRIRPSKRFRQALKAQQDLGPDGGGVSLEGLQVVTL